MAAAYEFVVQAYGWTHRYIEHDLTDELLVMYLDAASDRLTDQAHARFTEAVEAARAGAILARDQRAYNRWRSDVARKGRRVPGTTLEQLARDFPDHVALPN